jgi:hypothetical protein
MSRDQATTTNDAGQHLQIRTKHIPLPRHKPTLQLPQRVINKAALLMVTCLGPHPSKVCQ